LKADYAAKLQAAENRVRDIESARDEAKQQAAAMAQELEQSKKTAQQVGRQCVVEHTCIESVGNPLLPNSVL
jgi:hypothetical protein